MQPATGDIGQQQGLRRRRAGDDDAPTRAPAVGVEKQPPQNQQHATTRATAAQPTPPAPPPGTIAAAFRNSKGTELQALVGRIVAGAGFATSFVPSADKEFTVLLINLPFQTMVQTAEELGLRKRDLEGQVRTFTADSVQAFDVAPSPETLFTQAEQILLTEYRLDKIKPARSRFDDVNGNESLLEWCNRQNYLEGVFPLHDREAAASILGELSFGSPLLDVGGLSKVQDYFGDKVALYFAFLTFYTRSLILYAGVGIAVFLLSLFSPKRVPLLLFGFSIFAALWGASFTSLWKRRNIEVVYMWTSLIIGDSADETIMAMIQKEDLRNEFYGEEVSHRITGEKIVIFPKRKKIAMFTFSAMVVLVCLLISCKSMMAALDFEDIMDHWILKHAMEHKWSSPFLMRGLILKNMPLVVYLGCLNILDMIYDKVAERLTDLENHKYRSTHENSHVLKLVLFQFLNMNMAYLYVAFVRKDYVRLASSIRSILITEAVIGNVKEVIIPIYLAKRKKKAKIAAALAKVKAENPDLDESECVVDPRMVEDPIFDQLELEPYDGVFGDYFELVRQFSQITLFAAAFPLGGLLALLNNFTEIYSDLYKLVNTRRRASPRRALNIGAWIRAFECISVVSIMTNLGIIAVTANFADAVIGRGSTKSEEYFWMVVIEHALLASRFIFMGFFEGIPSWVRDQRAKERYLATKQLTAPHASGGAPSNDNVMAAAAALGSANIRQHGVSS